MPDPHDLEQDPLPLDDNRSAERLIDDLVTSGRYSQAELADILDRSPSLISKIRHGKKPGANLLGALRELDERDAVTQTPTRRRRKDGTVAKVRGKRGQGSVVPRIPEEPLTPTEVRRRHRPTRAPHQERDVQAQGRDLRDEPDTTDVAQAPPPVEHPAQPRLEKPRPPARNRLHFDVTTLPNGQRAALARWNPRNAGDRDRVADALADLVRHAAARGDRFQAVVQYEFDGQKYPVELGPMSRPASAQNRRPRRLPDSRSRSPRPHGRGEVRHLVNTNDSKKRTDFEVEVIMIPDFDITVDEAPLSPGLRVGTCSRTTPLGPACPHTPSKLSSALCSHWWHAKPQRSDPSDDRPRPCRRHPPAAAICRSSQRRARLHRHRVRLVRRGAPRLAQGLGLRK